MGRLINILYRNRIYIKFALSGSVSVLTEMIIITILTEIVGLYYVISAAFAFAAGFTVSFCLQKFWTFRHSNRKKIIKEIAQYLAVAVIGTIINVKLIYLLVECFRQSHHIKYDYIVFQALVGSAIGLLNYLIYRFIIFKKNKMSMPKRTIPKVLIAAGIFPPDIGGPATYSRTLLDELPKRGFEVELVTYGIPDKEAGNITPNIHIISRRQNTLFRYIKYFWKIFRLADDVDLVYIQGPVSEGLPASIACALQLKPYIVKVVGDYAWEQGMQRFGVEDLLDDFQKNKYSWQVQLFRWIESRVTKGANKVIVPSQYLKSIVKQWGVSDENIEVIYNSIEKVELNLRKSEAKSNLGITGDAIVSVGRVVKWKGFSLLVDLLPELLAANPNFKLIIIGDGPEKIILEEKVKQYGLERQIQLPGNLPRAKVLEYMRAADIFVLDSGYEGLAHVLIEAMMLGAPVIVSNVGGNPELVKDNETGLLIKYDNREELKAAIIKLWHNRALANQLSEEAQKFISGGFGREEMINRVVDRIFTFIKK